jgi:hypothetical protein
LPLSSMQSRLSKARYVFKPASSAEQKSGEPVDETQPPVVEESTFPGWVIPVVAGVAILGGVYWYMNRGV